MNASPTGNSSRPGGLARAAIYLVRVYQQRLSMLKPKTCRYYPTCSEYAARAISAAGSAPRRLAGRVAAAEVQPLLARRL